MSAVWLPRGYGRIGLLALALAGGLLTWRSLTAEPSHHAVPRGDPVIGRALAIQATSLLPGSYRASSAKKIGSHQGQQPNRPHLVNFFASWCVPCRVEAPVLAKLAAQGVRIDGVAVRDEPAAVARFLKSSGDPFATVRLDPLGRVQAALGVAGLPETYIINARGPITYRHRGALSPDDAARLAEHLK